MNKSVLILVNLILIHALLPVIPAMAQTAGYGFLQVVGGSKPDAAYRVAYMNASIYVVGYTMTFTTSPNGCGFLLILNETGAYQDLKVYCVFDYAYEELVDIAITRDGIFVIGNVRYIRPETREFDNDIVVYKLDFQGNVIWSFIIGRVGVPESSSSIHFSGDHLYIVGSSNDNALLVVLDLQGQITWSREIDLGHLERGVAVRTLGGLVYYLIRSYNKAHGYIVDHLVILDQAGVFLGGVTLEPNHYHTSLQVSGTGDLYLSGWIIDYSARTTIGFLKKLDYNLRPIWGRRLPSMLNNTMVYDISIDKTGYIYAAGRASNNAFIMKLTPLGVSLWIKTLRGERGSGSFFGVTHARGVTFATGVTSSWSSADHHTAAVVLAVTDDFQNEYVDHSRITLDSFTPRIETLSGIDILELATNTRVCNVRVASLRDRVTPRIIFLSGSIPDTTDTSEPVSTTTPTINIPMVTKTVTEYATITEYITVTLTETIRETLTVTITNQMTTPHNNTVIGDTGKPTITGSTNIEQYKSPSLPAEVFARGVAGLVEIFLALVLILGSIALLVYLINALSRYLKKS